ncbi:uncharacterized protein LOC144419998 [Styela clava]
MRGQIKLVACGTAKKLTVTLLGIRNILSSIGSSIYIKISLISEKSETHAEHIMKVHMAAKETILHETVSFNLSRMALNRRLLIEVWSQAMTPVNFKGCTSFGLRKFMTNNEIIQGSYYLLGENIGRRKHLAVKPNQSLSRENKVKTMNYNQFPAETSQNDKSQAGFTPSRKMIEHKEIQLSTNAIVRDVQFGAQTQSPPCVSSVTEGSQAYSVGLRERDVILSINGSIVNNRTNFEFQNLLRSCSGVVVLKIQRSHRNNRELNNTPKGGYKRKLNRKGGVRHKKRKLNEHRLRTSAQNNLQFITTREKLQKYRYIENDIDQQTPFRPQHDMKHQIKPIQFEDEDNDDVFLTEEQEQTFQICKPPLYAGNSIPCRPSNTPGTPLCLASVTYGANLQKSARIVRRRTYHDGKKQLAQLRQMVPGCESPILRRSAKRSINGYERTSSKRYFNKSESFRMQKSAGNEKFTLYYPDFIDFPQKFELGAPSDIVSSEINSSRSQNYDNDRVEIVSVTSSSDVDPKRIRSRSCSSESDLKTKEELQNNKNISSKIDWIETEKIKKIFRVKSRKHKNEEKKGYTALESNIINVSSCSSNSSSANGLLAILKDKGKCASFRAFLAIEHSEENLDFWTECESYKNKKTTKQRKLASAIYKKYIHSDAECEVNITSKIRSMITEKLQNPTSEMFQEAQDHIFRLMESDSYRRYISQN